MSTPEKWNVNTVVYGLTGGSKRGDILKEYIKQNTTVKLCNFIAVCIFVSLFYNIPITKDIDDKFIALVIQLMAIKTAMDIKRNKKKDLIKEYAQNKRLDDFKR